MMRSKKILFALVLAVIISGCVNDGRKPTFDTNNGIIINEFSVEPMPAKGGSEVTFFVDIENVGGSTARSIDVTLLGIENPWKKNANPVARQDVTMHFNSMNPPSVDKARPGDFKIASFILNTPSMPEGVNVNFPVTARVVFEYGSSAVVTIPAYSSALYAAKRGRGENVDTQPRLDNSHAPVQVRITRAPVPLIVDEKRTGNEIVTFIFEFADVGSGSPLVVDDSNAIGRLNGRMTLEGPGVSFSDCLGQNDGNEIETMPLDLIKLRSDRRVPFGCSIKIDRSQWQSASKSDSIVFIIELQYFYFVEKSAEVPVIGTGNAPLSTVPGQQYSEGRGATDYCERKIEYFRQQGITDYSALCTGYEGGCKAGECRTNIQKDCNMDGTTFSMECRNRVFQNINVCCYADQSTERCAERFSEWNRTGITDIEC